MIDNWDWAAGLDFGWRETDALGQTVRYRKKIRDGAYDIEITVYDDSVFVERNNYFLDKYEQIDLPGVRSAADLETLVRFVTGE